MSRAKISAQAERNLRREADDRCGYCLSPKHLVFSPLKIEHLRPLALGGSDTIENLWLSCPICNGHKSAKVDATDPVTQKVLPLFNPRFQCWTDHFRWSENGIRVAGTTAVGRATVAALKLDSDPIAIEVRSYWVAAGWHPPNT